MTSPTFLLCIVPLFVIVTMLYVRLLQEAVDVSHAQAGKLMQRALGLRVVYQNLLAGATKREAFESTAKFLDVASRTVEQWERTFRDKGHIEVHAMYMYVVSFRSVFDCMYACVCFEGRALYFCECFSSHLLYNIMCVKFLSFRHPTKPTVRRAVTAVNCVRLPKLVLRAKFTVHRSNSTLPLLFSEQPSGAFSTHRAHLGRMHA